jgi:hypothetical protein
MASARQLELIPPKKQTAADRRELIRKRLEGLEYRQQARDERRRSQQRRRQNREAAAAAGGAAQMTLEEMIERLRSQA